ncbi:MAG: hypothetical protein LBE58_16330 [Comamonas sp.]|jgi:hypothetical protein|nr:hypothetical protein [Comamonas sp.]
MSTHGDKTAEAMISVICYHGKIGALESPVMPQATVILEKAGFNFSVYSAAKSVVIEFIDGAVGWLK